MKIFIAQAVRRLMEVDEALQKAGKEAVAAQNSDLFKWIHEKRMEVWNRCEALMKECS